MVDDRNIDYSKDEHLNVIPVFFDESETQIKQYFEPPQNFIPESVREWYREYKYYTEFGASAPSYSEVSSRFIMMLNTYNYYLSYWDDPNNTNGGYS